MSHAAPSRTTGPRTGSTESKHKFAKVRELARSAGEHDFADCGERELQKYLNMFAPAGEEAVDQFHNALAQYQNMSKSHVVVPIVDSSFADLLDYIKSAYTDDALTDLQKLQKTLALYQVSTIKEMRHAVFGLTSFKGAGKIQEALQTRFERERPDQKADTALILYCYSVARVLKMLVESLGVGILGMLPVSVVRHRTPYRLSFLNRKPLSKPILEELIQKWTHNMVSQQASRAGALVQAVLDGETLPQTDLQLWGFVDMVDMTQASEVAGTDHNVSIDEHLDSGVGPLPDHTTITNEEDYSVSINEYLGSGVGPLPDHTTHTNQEALFTATHGPSIHSSAASKTLEAVRATQGPQESMDLPLRSFQPHSSNMGIYGHTNAYTPTAANEHDDNLELYPDSPEIYGFPTHYGPYPNQRPTQPTEPQMYESVGSNTPAYTPTAAYEHEGNMELYPDSPDVHGFPQRYGPYPNQQLAQATVALMHASPESHPQLQFYPRLRY